MTARATCPYCRSELTGNPGDVAKHVAGCRRKPSKKATARGAPLRTPRRLGVVLPDLPISIYLDRPTPSQNDFMGRHWSAKQHDRLAWAMLLRPHLQQAGLIDARLDWAVLRITRRYAAPKRRFDPANLVGGCKQLIDSLKKDLNVLEDDNEDHLHVADYLQLKVDELTGTVIELLEARL